MLHFVWNSATFYLIVLVYNIDTKNKTNRSEKIFAGVIQNITRVNRVLEDLIHNYENLQKIYDSEEIADNRETNNLSQRANKTDLASTENKRTNLENNPATEIIWSIEKESDLDESVSSESDTSIIMSPTKSPATKTKREKQKTTQSELLLLLSSTESEEDNGLAINFDNEISNTYEDTNDADNQKPLKNVVKKKNTTLKVINTTKKKNRFIIQHSYTPADEIGNENNGTIKKPQRHDNKDEYTNMSASNDVVIVQGNVKPLQLFNDKEISRNSMTTENVVVQSKTNHTSSALPTNEADVSTPVKVQKKYDKKKVDDNYDDTNLNDLTEILKKEELNTDLLRKAYGDACLKYVLKKCYKACEDTLKNVCRTKCNHSIKSVFKNKYKGQCDILFADVNYRSSHKTGDIINRDLTTFCQLEFNNKTEDVNDQSREKQLNILRGKYEKACVKASREKCNDACTYSYKKACEAGECNHEQRKDFEKTCKQRCRIEFREIYRKTKKQSSSSSESSRSSSSSVSSD